MSWQIGIPTRSLMGSGPLLTSSNLICPSYPACIVGAVIWIASPILDRELFPSTLAAYFVSNLKSIYSLVNANINRPFLNTNPPAGIFSCVVNRSSVFSICNFFIEGSIIVSTPSIGSLKIVRYGSSVKSTLVELYASSEGAGSIIIAPFFIAVWISRSVKITLTAFQAHLPAVFY